MHITSFLGGENQHLVQRVLDYIRMDHRCMFELVQPVYQNDRIVAIVMYSKDLDNVDNEMTMEYLVKGLSGWFEHGFDIVSAWELDHEKPRRRVLRIPGSVYE